MRFLDKPVSDKPGVMYLLYNYIIMYYRLMAAIEA